MEVRKIMLNQDDRIGDILKYFQSCPVPCHALMVCPRNFSLLSDTGFLKKIKEAALDRGVKLSLVITQKFLRDVAISQKLDVHARVPKEYAELPEFELSPQETVTNEPLDSESPEATPEPEDPAFSTRTIKQPRGSTSRRGIIFFGFLLIIALLGLVFFLISPQATVHIKPRISVLPLTQNLIVYFEDAEIPEESQTLPAVKGIFVQTTVESVETFPATGRTYDVTNASGKITLFNETSAEKYLVPSRLSTHDGMIFRFENDVTIPPHDGDKPGTAVVTITADPYDIDENPTGDRGNLEAGTELFFPALRDELQELYYGKVNKGPLVGGSTLTHYFVEETDFEHAEALMLETFRFRALEELRAEIDGRSAREKKRYVLMENPGIVRSELVEAQFPEDLVGTEIQTFDASAKLNLSSIVFDQSEVVVLLKEKLRATQDYRKKILSIDEASVQYQVLETDEDFNADQDVDEAGGLVGPSWVKFSVSLVGTETLDIGSQNQEAVRWRKKLKEEIAGKPLEQVRSVLTNHPEIETITKLQVSPFWAKSIPGFLDQIDFRVVESE